METTGENKMTPEQFCYWLQGFAELNGTAPNQKQWDDIEEHLKTVFTKVTPQTWPFPICKDGKLC